MENEKMDDAAMSPEELEGRVAALGPMLADPDPRVRKSAAVALGRMPCEAASAALSRLLGDADEGVRVLACQALGRLARASAIPSLLAHVHDESAHVKAGVLWALANLAAHGGLSSDQLGALFSPVVVMAFDPDDGVRADAAAVIGALHDPRATDALLVLLEDGCPRVRANACSSLGLSDDEAGLEALLGVLETRDAAEMEAVSALDGLARRAQRGSLEPQGPQAARALDAACVLATRSDDPDVRSTAVWALGILGPLVPAMRAGVDSALAHALQSGQDWEIRYAIDSLELLGDEDARATLERFANTAAPEHATLCAAALERI